MIPFKQPKRRRRKNTEMFALKRPSRAMQALFAFSTFTTTLANSTSNDTSFTNLSVESEFLCVVFFTALLAIFLQWLSWKTMSLMPGVLDDSCHHVSHLHDQVCCKSKRTTRPTPTSQPPPKLIATYNEVREDRRQLIETYNHAGQGHS